MAIPPYTNPAEVAELWEGWCGPTPWSEGLRTFAKLGGTIQFWCGRPRSASAIPLTFVLRAPDNTEFNGSRLKDIRAAIAHCEA